MTPISSVRGGRNWSGGLWKRTRVGAVQRHERKRISATGLGNGLGSQEREQLS